MVNWRRLRPARRVMVPALLIAAVVIAIAALAEFGVGPSWRDAARKALDHWPGLLLALLAAAAVGTAAKLWLAGRPAHPPADPPTASTTNWTAVTSLVTAFTALAALVFTGLSLQANRDQVAVAEQGQITERYTRAVEQIGTPGPERLQVRLGGVYALERLATDSPRDRDTVTDVMAAFVRSSAPRTKEPCPREMPADVQAAFTVLTRRPPAQRKFEGVDLRDTCLVGAVAVMADLRSISFAGSDLSNARFAYSHLLGITFSRAVMRGASLEYIHDEGYTFIQGADLTNASLQHADLKYTDLSASDLTGADLSDAKLTSADLTGVRHDATTITTDVHVDEYTKGVWWQ